MVLPLVYVILCLSWTVQCENSLSRSYFSSLLLNSKPHYQLFWSVDLEEGTIAFAINASTSGWVGFGLSPTGGMTGADVVIGYQDRNGNIQFHDRYARGTYLPEIDKSQDWIMSAGNVQNEYMLVEFQRSLETCDAEDIDITTSTSHVIWSLGNSSSVSFSPLMLLRHTARGVKSVNFLGGPHNISTHSGNINEKSFTITTNQTLIPSSDTTYWCTVFELPTDERYIYKISPVIATASEPYVHHMLIYQCNNVPFSEVGMGQTCEDISEEISRCRGSHVLSGWAIGGQDFVYPTGVAFKIGGEGAFRYALLEIHYDNPKHVTGVNDSSGMQFFYTNTAPEKSIAGIMAVGHHVTTNMLIPPNTEKYDILGLCSNSCTKKFLRPEGISVFAGLLHTHLTGRSVELRHYRQNEECNVTEELPPIDINRNYDVDYQQVNTYPNEVTILPGDSIVLKCTYETKDGKNQRTNITVGGEGTYDEMCLTFLFYYPAQNLSLCASMPDPQAAYKPIFNILLKPDRVNLTDLLDNNFGISHSNAIKDTLQPIKWTQQLVLSLQKSVLTSPAIQLCLDDFSNLTNGVSNVSPPNDDHCTYEPPNVCTGYTPTPCCLRVKGGGVSLSFPAMIQMILTTVGFYITLEFML